MGLKLFKTSPDCKKCIHCTFRSWVHAIFSHYRTVFPQLGDNYAWKCSSDNFPHINICHHVWKAVRTTMQSNLGLQARGKGNEMEKNCRTNLSYSFRCFSNLLSRIGEQLNITVWFWKFSTHDDIYFVCGKMSDLDFYTQLFPNRGETVL